MAFRLYLQQEESTSLQLNLDMIFDMDLGTPGNDYKLVETLSEGGRVIGVGQFTGRAWSGSYNFRGNDHYERTEIQDYFSKDRTQTVYLYKEIWKRLKFDITSGSTIAIFNGSTTILRELSTGDAITGIGLSTNTNIDTIASTYVLLDTAPVSTINNQEFQVTTFTGRTRVYGLLNPGEPWNNDSLSDSVKFNLLAESPYFESTSLAVHSFTSTSVAEFDITITNQGNRVNALYEFTGSTSYNIFSVKHSEGYGFRASNQASTEVIQVDTRNSDLVYTVDGIKKSNVFSSADSPFPLQKGDNTLTIIAQESTADGLKVKYYERQL
jgi:hypothetical protein